MNLQDLLNHLVGTSGSPGEGSPAPGGLGRLAGTAAVGGVLGLLLGRKSTRWFAGKAAKFGGMAVLGGLAYRAFQNWQQNQAPHKAPGASLDDVADPDRAFLPQAASPEAPLELTLVRAMIAAARADGHIDEEEQQRIFEAVERMSLPSEQRAVVFDCLREGISVADLAAAVDSVEHKSQVYLAACLAVDGDDPRERAWLAALADALKLPDGLLQHLEHQAREGLASIA